MLAGFAAPDLAGSDSANQFAPASADRRPVDPPPVVELRIFEGGPTLEQSKDITFLYNANFFLYATLEHARVMAHGRVHNAAANAPPVLTDMPVSGMAYLDRPQEAGYFLFPDLSVRHEGRYRLTFSLYEQAKEDKDKDAEKSDQSAVEAGDSFDWRMEIKSNDFIVFSAKKFPGLTESTALSRTVAEQGCRVRIRRDVRMRRRDGKGAGDYDNAEDEYARRRRTQTPEASSQYRNRSMSSESVQRTPYQPDPQRRPSGAEYPPPPPGFSGSQPSGGHLSFGSHYPSQPYQSQHHAQPSSVPQSPSYAPAQQAYPPHQNSYPAPPPPAPAHSAYQERPPSQHYSTTAPSPRRDSYPTDYRRSSTSTYPAPPTPHSATEPEYRPEPARQYAAPPPLAASIPMEPKPVSLPPLSTAFGPPPSDSMIPARAPLPSPTIDRSSSFSYQYPSAQPSLPGLGKRSWADANPVSAHSPYTYKNHSRQPEQTDEIENIDDLVWKRADGSHRRGDLPGQILQ